MSEPLLSIIVATYNQEKYIKQAIQSILMQKVEFEYEVLIGEDCSTDNTKKVIEEMMPSFPDSFHVFFRNPNMGRKGVNNFNDLYSRAKGKYIIVLEGDDYWLYDEKLQKQVDFLESHPDYIAVGHQVLVVDKNGKIRNDYVYPTCPNFEYTFDGYRNFILAGQTATIMKRNPLLLLNYKDYVQNVDYPGDQKNNFIYLCNGKVACIQEKWSAYRYVTDEGDSFSANIKKDKTIDGRRIDFLKEMNEFALANFDKKSMARKCVQSMYIQSLLSNSIKRRNKKYNVFTFIKEFFKADSKKDVIKYIIKRFKLRKK